MQTTTPNSHSLSLMWQLCFCVMLTAALFIVPQEVWAQTVGATGGGVGGKNAIQTVLCNITDLLNGPTGKAIATIAIIIVGVGALMGKVSWGMALIVALGVALIFGASSIVDAIAGNKGQCSGGVV